MGADERNDKGAGAGEGAGTGARGAGAGASRPAGAGRIPEQAGPPGPVARQPEAGAREAGSGARETGSEAREAGPGARATAGRSHGAGVTAGPGRGAFFPVQREAGSGRETAGDPAPGSDAELIVRMRAGDDSAYEALYRRHADAVRRYARTCCRDAHTADDLTAEVFAAMLQAVRGGAGPRHAVRAYLLTTVRRTAAGWIRSTRREQLVDDFAVFVEQSIRGTDRVDDDTLELGADVRAMHEADQSLAMRAFRSLPERWQAVLWHTEVEDESPGEVATLFGLDANGTRVLASRAREGLKQAYLQAHVSATLTADAECARHADRLGAFARGGLRIRAERGLRKHLEECARCRMAAGQIKEVAQGIPAVVPVAVIGWFAAAGYAKVAGLVAGGTGAGAVAAGGSAVASAGAGGGAGGATAAAGGAGGATAAAGGAGGVVAGGSGAGTGAGAGGGGAVAEGLGAPAKAGIAAGVVTVAAAVVALALIGDDRPAPSTPVAGPPPVSEPAAAPEDAPPSPGPARPAQPVEAGAASSAPPEPGPSAEAPVPSVEPSPSPSPAPAPEPEPGPAEEPSPPPPVVPAEYRWSGLPYGVSGDGSGPEMRLAQSTWVWQRRSLTVAGVTYPEGVTVNGRSSVVIDLNRSCTSYRAMAGIDDMSLGLGSAVFSIHADGVRLWQSGVVRAGDPAVPVSVALSGRRTVRLVVEPRGGALAVPADWAASRFVCG
ncbi:sigma-70 family RNA polymerase sigma factor [Streptomyces sp. NPDC002734]|uniref:sigma-70 family RNA polymerase sigma factor n=1 Tax=Streptomyces sp. NPDC002734 TaxID=3154426 RepID=UPI0033339389